jgi:Mrp family chromosome partitioning ATPase
MHVGLDRDGTGERVLDVLPAGPVPPNASDLVGSARMRDILRDAEARYDLVIVDTPPTSVVADAIPLVNAVSGVIVVSRLGATTRESAAHLRYQLDHLNAHLLGVVVNFARRDRDYSYSYGYGASQGSGRRHGGRTETTLPV